MQHRKVFNCLLFFCLLLSANRSLSQNFFTSAFLGSSNYQGDLEDKVYSAKHTHFAGGLGLTFELNPQLLIRGDFSYGKISAADADGVKNRTRNLSFTSSVAEFSIGLEYLLLDLYEKKITPYAFVSLGLFKFSPYTKDRNGNLISLYELSTEGEGFYKDRKPYKLSQFCIPFGGGVQYAISDNARIGLVIGIRKTFTDYIDDVSKTYVDKDLLRAKRGGNAVSYAYRGDEIPNGDPYPPADTQRGNPKSLDLYYFSGLTIRVRIPNRKTKTMNPPKFKKGNVGCPRF